MNQTVQKIYCLPPGYVLYMSIIILKFKYFKNDACTTRKIQNIIMADHVNFGILLTKGEQVRDKINFAFCFLSATAESHCQEVKKR